MASWPVSLSTLRCGFTLIEVVLVAVVIAILLTASVPRFQQTAVRLRREHAAFEIAQLLRYAHERAVAQGRETVWRWDAEARRAVIEQADAVSGVAEEIAKSAALPDEAPVSLTVQGSPVACACIRFYPDGTSEPVVLTVGPDPRPYTIAVHETTSHVTLTPGPAAR